ncbi:hypothetical protein [Saccharicrinis aurantiacus]|uniref:hypothetical protein n=1 Tax=Saccharicrinis aurantiacus TaxID=1849719 RepID=UPI000838419F|nr:hypothetical protein [Saccharicrinis aurantiacus]
MNNIYKIVGLLFVVLFSSCEPDKYARPDIKDVPVYQFIEYGTEKIKDPDGNEEIITIINRKINVYESAKKLVCDTDKHDNVRSMPATDLIDDTDDSQYQIKVTTTETRIEQRTITVHYNKDGEIVQYESEEDKDPNFDYTVVREEPKVIQVSVDYTYYYTLQGVIEEGAIGPVNGTVTIVYEGVVNGGEWILSYHNVPEEVDGTTLLDGTIDFTKELN